LSLAGMSGEQLEEQMSQALKENDKVLAQACYLESLHRSGDETDFNQAVGLQGSPSYRAAQLYRANNPDAEKRYRAWQSAKAERDDPNSVLMRGFHRAMGPKPEPGDTQGDAGAFLSDLFGNKA